MGAIKKAIGYLLTYGGATVVSYFVFSAGIYFYSDTEDLYSEANLATRVYLPYLYAFLGLAIMLLGQMVWNPPQRLGKTEKLYYGIFNLIFFLLQAVLGIVMVWYGSVFEAPLLSLNSAPLFIIAIIEISFGVYLIVQSAKAKKDVPQEPRTPPEQG
jgi:hypothetical protein